MRLFGIIGIFVLVRSVSIRMPKKRAFSVMSASGNSISTEKQYFLMKSEPETYSISDLANENKPVIWEGVRNYQARNLMRSMRVGDLGFFYHSNAGKTTGIVGTLRIAKAPYADPTALDKTSKYFDSKSTPDNNRWTAGNTENQTKKILLTPLKPTNWSRSLSYSSSFQY